jgi:hypothetical protein
VTLHNLGAVYDDLDQKQKALECYEEALGIHIKAGNRAMEGRH